VVGREVDHLGTALSPGSCYRFAAFSLPPEGCSGAAPPADEFPGGARFRRSPAPPSGPRAGVLVIETLPGSPLQVSRSCPQLQAASRSVTHVTFRPKLSLLSLCENNEVLIGRMLDRDYIERRSDLLPEGELSGLPVALGCHCADISGSFDRRRTYSAGG
jgi:hypothetical protein